MRTIFVLSATLLMLFCPFAANAKPRHKSKTLQQLQPGSAVVLNVKEFKAAGDGKADDTPAFAAALGKLAQLNGGTLLIPRGTYVVGNVKVGSGTFLKGIGPPDLVVVVKAPKAASILDISATVTNGRRALLHSIALENLTLHGRSLEDGFAEHTHNVNVVGVNGLVVSHVKFEAFQGDGLYLGSRLQPKEEATHNSNVVVSENSFDGINYQNRNGVSIIDCQHCRIDHNEFVNVSRPDMPGAIDLEPDQTDDIVQDIQITNNTILNNHGNVGSISVVTMVEHSQGASQISIQNNRIEGSKNGITILSRGDTAPQQDASTRVAIQGNQVIDTDRSLTLDGANAITIVGNDILRSRQGLLVGGRFGVRNVLFASNRLEHVGSDSGHGVLLVGPITSVVFEKNSFVDAGSKERDGSAVHFAKGEARNVTFRGNSFTSPADQTRVAVSHDPSVSFKAETNTWTANILKQKIQEGSFPHQH